MSRRAMPADQRTRSKPSRASIQTGSRDTGFPFFCRTIWENAMRTRTSGIVLLSAVALLPLTLSLYAAPRAAKYAVAELKEAPANALAAEIREALGKTG